MRLPLLELRDVTYRYSPRQERPSLDRVSLSIEEGVRTVILGANGAGKSTLFYHLNGVLKPAEGQVLYCGDTVIDAEAAQRAGVRFCPVLNGVTPAEAFAPYPWEHVASDLIELRRWLGI